MHIFDNSGWLVSSVGAPDIWVEISKYFSDKKNNFACIFRQAAYLAEHLEPSASPLLLVAAHSQAQLASDPAQPFRSLLLLSVLPAVFAPCSSSLLQTPAESSGLPQTPCSEQAAPLLFALPLALPVQSSTLMRQWKSQYG